MLVVFLLLTVACGYLLVTEALKIVKYLGIPDAWTETYALVPLV